MLLRGKKILMRPRLNSIAEDRAVQGSFLNGLKGYEDNKSIDEQ